LISDLCTLISDNDVKMFSATNQSAKAFLQYVHPIVFLIARFPMTRTLFFALLFIALLSYTSSLAAQWSQTAGPEGGAVNAIVKTGDYILAGTNDGVYRSGDVGTSWHLATAGIPVSTKILSFLPAWGKVYAGANNGAYVTADQGTHWTRVNVGLPPSTSVKVLAFNGTALLASAGNTLYRSTNEGESWTALPGSFPSNANANACIAVGGTFFTGTNGGGVYRSANLGDSWEPVNDGLTGFDLYNYALGEHHGTLLVGTLRRTFSSTDSGAHWLPADAGMPGGSGSKCFASIGSVLFAGITSGGVFRSTNGGASWTQMNTGLAQYPQVLSLCAAESTLLLGCSIDGMFRSTNSGISWQNESAGLANTSCKALAASGNVLFAGTIDADFGYVWRTTNSGTNWEPAITSNFPDVGIDALIVTRDGVLYAGLNGEGVFKSTDNGTTWTDLNTTFAYVGAFAANSTTLIAGSVGFGQGMFRTTNAGTTWVPANSGAPMSNISAMCTVGETIFAGLSGTGIYKTTDGGITWVLSNAGVTNIFINALLNAGSSIFAATYGGLFRSTDGGSNWALANDGIPANDWGISLAINGSTLYTGTRSHGVFRSTDNGDSWTSLNDGLPTKLDSTLYSPISSLHATNGSLFAGIDLLGVWKYPLTTTEISETHGSMPSDAPYLYQNYPNPFNPTTKISYVLNQTSLVTLTVFDILGREVETLVKGVKPAGNNEATFSATELASGIYFYRLQAEGFVQTRKLVVQK
jgi:hypothetical protein